MMNTKIFGGVAAFAMLFFANGALAFDWGAFSGGGDVSVSSDNSANINNTVSIFANTGGNVANGASGGDGGDGGSASNSGYGWFGFSGSSGGDSGNGGNGGNGGVIITGPAIATSVITNNVNTIDTSVNVENSNRNAYFEHLSETSWEKNGKHGHGMHGNGSSEEFWMREHDLAHLPVAGGDISVDNQNDADIDNAVLMSLNTGMNTANGASGGNGGNGMEGGGGYSGWIPWYAYDGFSYGNSGGNGGDGGAGGDGGTIVTGRAEATSAIVNFVNGSMTRVEA